MNLVCTARSCVLVSTYIVCYANYNTMSFLPFQPKSSDYTALVVDGDKAALAEAANAGDQASRAQQQLALEQQQRLRRLQERRRGLRAALHSLVLLLLAMMALLLVLMVGAHLTRRVR